MVKSQSGFSMIEVMVGVALLGLAVVGLGNFTKQDAKVTQIISIKEASVLLTKEVLIMLEHKTFCESVVKNKRSNDQIKFTSSEGIELQKNTLIHNKFKIEDLSVYIAPSTNLPTGFGLASIRYGFASSDGKTRTTDKVSFVVSMAGAQINSCVTPRDEGESLIENKATNIAKEKVCKEDLNGSIGSNGRCNWTEPVDYEYVEIQL